MPDGVRPLFANPTTEPVSLETALGAADPQLRAVKPHLAFDPQRAAEAARLGELENVAQEAEAARHRAVREAEAARADLTAKVDAYVDAIARLGETANALLAQFTDDIVELAMIVAREIIGRELGTDRDRIVAAIAQAMSGAEQIVTLRIGSSDLRHLKDRRPQLLEGRVRIVEDDVLDPGGFILECADTIIDGSVEARLEHIRAAMAVAFSDGGTQ